MAELAPRQLLQPEDHASISVVIVALSRVARPTTTSWASPGAALLLAVSYHHAFFSQNARGYIA